MQLSKTALDGLPATHLEFPCGINISFFLLLQDKSDVLTKSLAKGSLDFQVLNMWNITIEGLAIGHQSYGGLGDQLDIQWCRAQRVRQHRMSMDIILVLITERIDLEIRLSVLVVAAVPNQREQLSRGGLSGSHILLCRSCCSRGRLAPVKPMTVPLKLVRRQGDEEA